MSMVRIAVTQKIPNNNIIITCIGRRSPTELPVAPGAAGDFQQWGAALSLSHLVMDETTKPQIPRVRKIVRMTI